MSSSSSPSSVCSSLPPSSEKLGRAEKTRRRILEEALRLMSEKGFAVVTVEEIAAAAGVSHMTVFRNFPNKHEILAAILRQTPFRAPLEKTFATRTGVMSSDLEALVTTVIEASDRRAAAAALYLWSERPRNAGESESPTAQAVEDDIAFFRELLARYFREAEEQGRFRAEGTSPEAAAALLWSTVSGFLLGRMRHRDRAHRLPKLSVETFARETARLFAARFGTPGSPL